MTKKRSNEFNPMDMIAGASNSSPHTQSTGHIPSGLPIMDTGQSEQQKHTSSTEPETLSESKDLIHQPEPIRRITGKYRRTLLEEYHQTFLQVPHIIDRKPVFVSASVREQLDQIVRRLGDRKMSVSGLIENLARNHIETYGEDIEQWKRL